MTHRLLCCLLIGSLLSSGGSEALCQSSPFTLVGAGHGRAFRQATVILAADEAECVRLAVADLVSDVQKITGRQLRVETATPGQRYQNAVIVGIQGRSSLVGTYLPDSRQVAGRWENYRVQSVGSNLVLTGSDERGTVFAVYHFIEQYLGVDPLYFWSDREPAKRTELRWSNVFIRQTNPTFRYRGWFINDEDLLTEWKRPGRSAGAVSESGGKRNIDYPFYGQVVAPETMRHVVEALVRLRQNLLIPASFIDIRNPAEAALVQEAARRGVFVSMHHVEPMGVSAFTYFNYWKAKDSSQATHKPPLFSYFSNRRKLEEVWRVYAAEWAKYPNVIWQIGLRGIGDRPMWLADPGIPQTDADRGRLISDAMQAQMQIIREVDKRSNPPITTTLWAEGSVLNKAGHLRIPDGVTVVFADNSPGWRMQADFHDTPRTVSYRYGVYYHHQLWGSGPHLVQIVSPAQTHKVLREVVAKGDTNYAILNVSNLREFVLGVDASARMLSHFSTFQPEAFLNSWCAERYGRAAAEVKASYRTYFNGFATNSQTGTPILMDGQMRSTALNLLTELRLQLSDSVAYAARQQQKKTETEESRWIKTALADMGSGALTREALLTELVRQKTAHQRANSLARRVLPRLDSDGRRFLETNLLAHLDLILGLESWLEAVIQAKLAADAGRKTDVANWLKRAVDAFPTMQAGMQLSTGSPKWANWYRGEKKMNIMDCQRQTVLVRELAETGRKSN